MVARSRRAAPAPVAASVATMSTVLTRVKPAANQATGDGGPAWPSASAATVRFSSTSGVYPPRASSSSSPPRRWRRHTRPATQAPTPASAARPTRRVAQRAAEHARRHRPAPPPPKTVSAPDIALSPVAAGPAAPRSAATATGAMPHRAGRPSSRPPVCARQGALRFGRHSCRGWSRLASESPATCACTMGRNRLRRVDTAMSGLTGGYGVGESAAAGPGHLPQAIPLKGLTSAERARSIMSAEPPSRRAAEPPSRRAAEPPSRRAAEPPSRRAAEPPSRRAAEPPSRRAADDECVRRRAASAPRSGLPA